jgi:hypothetical protein
MASILKVDQIRENTIGGGVNIFNQGSPGSPTLSIGSQTNKGLYDIGTDRIGVSVNGLRVGEIGPGYGGFTGNIIQVQQTIRTSNYYNSGTSTFIDIPGLSVDITPRYVGSKILVIYDIAVGGASSQFFLFKFVRNSTDVYVGTDVKTFTASKIYYAFNGDGTSTIANLNGIFLDSPNSTSAVTYKVQARTSSGGAFAINRRVGSDDSSLASSVTVLEIQHS